MKIMITPAIHPGYWKFRVPVSEDQAIVGFPKFTTIGIGFQYEDADWNTNLPYTSDAEKIYEHIAENSRGADREKCIAAIREVQQMAKDFMEGGSK